MAGFILPGDHVDIVLIRTGGSGGEQRYADVIVQNVKVLAVDQLTNERPDKANVVAKAVTVEVSSGDAQKIVLATDVGKLSLTLRQSDQAGLEPSRRITERDLTVGDSAPVKTENKIDNKAPIAPPQPVTRNSTVVIVHGMTSQEYTVVRDGM